MMNDELKALYEKYPWAWIPQIQTVDKANWIDKPDPMWIDCYNYRLKPKLPADLPEPTEDMMNRAVYLGQGPIKMPHENTFKGYFVWVGEGEWRGLGNQYGRQPDYHYCIDINDPNADEIIALNRAEAKMVTGTGAKPPQGFIDVVFDGPPGHTPGRFVEVEAPDGRSVRVGEWVHRDDGYWVLRIQQETPPGESEWLRLDECEVEVTDGENGWHEFKDLTAPVSWIKHGPASVRVRRKK